MVESDKKGFSLITVLIGLSVLIVFYVSVSEAILQPQLTLRRLSTAIEEDQRRDAALAQARPLVGEAMLASSAGNTTGLTLDGTPFEFLVDGAPQTIVVQDIGGLIDLNSASPELISRYFENLDETNGEAAAQNVMELRNAGTVIDIEDFLAKLLISEDVRAQAKKYLTLRSGARHLNPDTAPMALLELLSGQTGERAALVAQLGARYFKRGQVKDVVVRLLN